MYMDAHNSDIQGENTKKKYSRSQNLTHYKT